MVGGTNQSANSGKQNCEVKSNWNGLGFGDRMQFTIAASKVDSQDSLGAVFWTGPVFTSLSAVGQGHSHSQLIFTLTLMIHKQTFLLSTSIQLLFYPLQGRINIMVITWSRLGKCRCFVIFAVLIIGCNQKIQSEIARLSIKKMRETMSQLFFQTCFQSFNPLYWQSSQWSICFINASADTSQTLKWDWLNL